MMYVLLCLHFLHFFYLFDIEIIIKYCTGILLFFFCLNNLFSKNKYKYQFQIVLIF